MHRTFSALALVWMLAACASGAEPLTALTAPNGDIAGCLDTVRQRAVPCPAAARFVHIHPVASGPIAWSTGAGAIVCTAGSPRLHAAAAPSASGRALAVHDPQDAALRRRVWEAVVGQGPFKDRPRGEEAQLNFAFAVDLDGDGRDETVFEIEEVEVLSLPDVGLIRSFEVVNGIIGADGGPAALFAKAAMHDPLAGLVPVGERAIGLVFANVENVTVVTFNGRTARVVPGRGAARCRQR